MAIATEKKIKGHRVGVDTVGLGAAVADLCKEAGLDVVEMIGGGSGKDILGDSAIKPYNFRAAMFIALQIDIKSGELAFGDKISGEMREKVMSELGMILYDFASEMRWRIQKKEDIKKNHGISPDIADALAYANWVRRQKVKTKQAPTVLFGGTIKQNRR